MSPSHRDHPFELELGGSGAPVDYEPAESTSGLFGGNSNWRGPVWFPVNYLVIEALRRFDRYLGDDFTVEFPTGSGSELTLGQVADELAARLIALFLDDADGRRPVFGADEKFQPTRRGTTRSRSTSTSTATRARAWAPRTRRDGPAGGRPDRSTHAHEGGVGWLTNSTSW